MEVLIVMCLLIVIILLAKDKVVIKKIEKNKQRRPPVNPDLPEIMGRPKPLERQLLPNKAAKRQSEKRDKAPHNFETETDKTSSTKIIPQEELDEVFGSGPDLEEEEEELSRYSSPNGDDGFATGVTFDELSALKVALQQQVLEPALGEKAAAIVQRIQGTELFSLLENSMEGASARIVVLLDSHLPAKTDSGSSKMRKSGLEHFDIGEFV